MSWLQNQFYLLLFLSDVLAGTNDFAAGIPLETADTWDLGSFGAQDRACPFDNCHSACTFSGNKIAPAPRLHRLAGVKNLGVLQQPPAVHALAFTRMDPPFQRWRIQ
jgi:hypothetical protein